MPFGRIFLGEFGFEVKPTICRVDEDSVIIKDERVILSLKAETYGVPISLHEKDRGIVFFGKGDYLVNSRIKTYAGTYSKQYTDSFVDWGVIIGSVDNWSEAHKNFKEVEEVPRGFKNREEFIEKAKKELYSTLIRGGSERSIERADWFFKVNGSKGRASLHYRGGAIVFKGCDTSLVARCDDQVVLREGDVNLVLNGDKIVLRSKEGRLVANGENVVSHAGVISAHKIVTKGLVGKHLPEELVERVKAEALSLIPKALEGIGYKLE